MKHLLFISIEDLNDWIAPLGGHPDAVTPNMQRLAASGVLFANAHCAAPVCSPSRTATMFSRFPWETGHYTNAAKWFHEFPGDGRTSLIGRLRAAGYTTIGCGKIAQRRQARRRTRSPTARTGTPTTRAEAKPQPACRRRSAAATSAGMPISVRCRKAQPAGMPKTAIGCWSVSRRTPGPMSGPSGCTGRICRSWCRSISST